MNEKLKSILKKIMFVSIILIAFFTGAIYTKVDSLRSNKDVAVVEKTADRNIVLPEKGFELPISWGDLGPKLISAGVIDEKKFLETVNLNSDEEKILKEGGDKNIVINADNSQFVVDLLWAIGLAQKSNAYIDGPIGKEYKKDAGNFSSTGGWTLAKGSAINYLGKFEFLNLTPDQQKRVEDIAKNVYRPCCGNSSWFPDCNHGMAALAAIEMMVAKNLPDDEIYKNVLKLNSFWFQDTYLTIATYFERKGTSWDKIDAKKVLSADFSSSTGATRIKNEVNPAPSTGGGSSCGA